MVDMNRRRFLQAVPSAAAVVAIPSAVAGVAVEGIAAPIQASGTEYPFRWWVSYDGGEMFSDYFDTKEEAIAAAQGQTGGGMIAECQQQDFDLRIDGGQLYELLSESNSELIGDGDFIYATDEQIDELEASVNAVIKAWAEKHDLNRTAWQFATTRNHEVIEEPEEQVRERWERFVRPLDRVDQDV